eukprot:gnl/Ergobibamus_cyprinoides/3724.p1 GENE.gnl/Ergobibamus_cyprinoides/3724~~gnl/Ergobibamus_cyprinoides/3724.p1  ORF type:complete len:146 (+),score=10.03 gnl/Ergobibamus_cyprinoides/3724:242-679(+)
MLTDSRTHSTRLQRETVTLDQQLTSLTRRVQRAEKAHEQTDDDLERLEERFTTAREDTERVNERVRSLKEQCAALRTSCDVKSAALLRLIEHRDELKVRRDELSRQVRQAEAENAKLTREAGAITRQSSQARASISRTQRAARRR